ncbi:RGG repeats nuclear RNA binding protein A-like isoform X7 [Camellia sinensis]|uniref:RGG repeats nuclear RNA binding protein A-like isoform X7 n=1 Tax=Camellia sinensis TaxID=4442 RepID=UPI001036E785|nr:RGG repeats nuclear RNA binding protein A-like isoform X7 [Camellia sinensis]
MATTNLFDLLGDDENDDPNQLLQKLPPPPKKAPAPAQSAAATQPAKLPSKPLPPAQAGETMTTLLSDKCTKLLMAVLLQSHAFLKWLLKHWVLAKNIMQLLIYRWIQ